MTEEDQLRELGRLYNYRDDDSPQFTRWQMLVAIRHGINLSQASPPPEAANEIERLREALAKIRDFEPSDGMCNSPYSQIAVFAKQTAREALSLHKADRHE